MRGARVGTRPWLQQAAHQLAGRPARGISRGCALTTRSRWIGWIIPLDPAEPGPRARTPRRRRNGGAARDMLLARSTVSSAKQAGADLPITIAAAGGPVPTAAVRRFALQVVEGAQSGASF